MSLCSVVTITTAVNTAAVVTVEMKRSCVPLQPLTALTASVSVSLILSLSAACLFLFTLLLYVLWMEVVDVKSYILQERGETCLNAEVSVLYGLSFMVAAAGVPLELISGLVFLLVGRAIHASKWPARLDHRVERRGAGGGGEAWLFYVLHLTGLACFWDVNTGKTAAALGLLEVFCLSPTLLNFSSNVTIYLNMLSLPCFTIATNDKQTVRSARVNQLCPDSGAWSKCV